jgi:hypothetical protein
MTTATATDTAANGASPADTSPADARDISRIDEALKDLHVPRRAGTNEDVDAESLEGRLRLALPGHTHFSVGYVVPAGLQRVLEAIGADPVQIPNAPTAIEAKFSEPTGLWTIEVQTCHDGHHGYAVEVCGPNTKILRSVQTINAVLELIQFCRQTFTDSQ